ncbi:FHA domain-containing protein [Glycomyces harbinensis]|uniref:FHA domain-containing protein n=1 Tax=Glycomyces harbinensis TaxID=58114 RepID=A0A1G6R417_9ACTN|nr:FHA domain-containing protein [Glycomyces harbinensis]SDC99399.1 FHA domain-containing protein [Glycomyces harbinensis]
MTFRCPNGHASADPDLCTACAMPMSDSVGLPRNPTFLMAPKARCSSCGAVRGGDHKYCPECGTRYAAETDPPTPPVLVADFEVRINVDRGYYDDTAATRGDERPVFPSYAPERTVRLRGEAVEIGRVRRVRPGGKALPPVNLAEKPAADLGVSHVHAVLQREGDDWTVTDLDSKNGTYVSGVRLESGAPRLLAPDDVINIGFFTAITLHRKDTEGSRP